VRSIGAAPISSSLDRIKKLTREEGGLVVDVEDYEYNTFVTYTVESNDPRAGRELADAERTILSLRSRAQP
jgi:hypothetical protein